MELVGWWFVGLLVGWLVGWLVVVVTRGWSNGLHVLPPEVPSEYSTLHSVTWCKLMLSSYRIAVGIWMWNVGCCSEKPLYCGLAYVLVRERHWCAVVLFTAAEHVFCYGSGSVCCSIIHCGWACVLVRGRQCVL